MSELLTFETRLVTIDSSQRTNPLAPTTDFEVALPSVSSIRDDVVGCSVESISFPNLIGNVYSSLNLLYVDYEGASYEIAIPRGAYNYVDLCTVLTEALNTTLGLAPDTVEVVPIAPIAGQSAEIGFLYDGASPINITAVKHTLSYVIGIPMGSVIQLGFGLPSPSFRPNLFGPLAVMLHTSLSGSRASINGLGQSSRAVMTIPIADTGYGQLVHQHSVGAERPLVVYSQGIDLTNITVALKHLTGEPIDIGTAPMLVTFRVWLKHR